MDEIISVKINVTQPKQSEPLQINDDMGTHGFG